jgi:CYTH domain-containing protein
MGGNSMKRELALNQAFQRILNIATTMDEAKLLYHNALAEIYPFDFELELAVADAQRILNWSHDKVIDTGKKVGA